MDVKKVLSKSVSKAVWAEISKDEYYEFIRDRYLRGITCKGSLRYILNEGETKEVKLPYKVRYAVGVFSYKCYGKIEFKDDDVKFYCNVALKDKRIPQYVLEQYGLSDLGKDTIIFTGVKSDDKAGRSGGTSDGR